MIPCFNRKKIKIGCERKKIDELTFIAATCQEEKQEDSKKIQRKNPKGPPDEEIPENSEPAYAGTSIVLLLQKDAGY